jgi:light-regulated signal transduction histidine kinase (bacteriophytochrome)
MMAGLPARYSEALRAHLAGPSEETLAAAYELGRDAMHDGTSLLDLSAAHHHALGQLAAEQVLTPGLLEAARAFLCEALSVFEMVNRGYRAANESLRARNLELEQAKEAVEATSRELESFSYSVSHDLRAPLRSIDGFSQALEEDNGRQLDEVGRSHLKRVREATRRMAALIDDLLRLARISRGELTKEIVDLTPIVRSIVERLRRAEPSRQVELVVPDHLMARGDPRLLAVALENLLSNAWKFTSKRPVAHLEVGLQPGKNVYFVHDDGAGFDMRYSDRLFGAFQRLHTVQEFEGTGIGLATVQRIVRRHGGRIWAEAGVDQGATFYFTLGD